MMRKLFVVGAALLSAVSVLADVPVAVSPGEAARELAIRDGCPTFSWSTVPGASAYEIAVYEVPTSASSQGVETLEPVWSVRLAGKVGTWTPSLDRCLSPGGRFAWVLRAQIDTEPGRWSAPVFFRVVQDPDLIAIERGMEGQTPPEGSAAGGRTASREAAAFARDELSSPPAATPGTANPSGEFSVDGLGNVSATSYSGDGSSLVNVTGSDLDCVDCVNLDEVSFTPALAGDLVLHSGDASAHHEKTINTDILASLGCRIGQVAWYDGRQWTCRNFVDGPTSESCPAGTSVVGFDHLGALVCGGSNQPVRTPITEVGVWSNSNGMAIDADGLPVITFYEGTGTLKKLKLIHCELPDCFVYSEETLKNNVDWLAGNTAVAIGTDGFPVVAYFDGTDLEFIHCTSVDCSTRDPFETVIGTGPISSDAFVDVAISPAGLPAISSYKFQDLEFILCGDAACSSATVSPIDGPAGKQSALAFGADDLALIAYEDTANGEIEVAHCSDADCTTVTYSTPGPGEKPALLIEDDGTPVLAFNSGGVTVRRCQDATCSSSTVESVTADPVEQVAMDIGTDGLPLILFQTAVTRYRRVLHCGDSSCSSGNSISTVDRDIGGRGLVAVPADGLPVVSIGDTVIKCGRYDCAYP